MDSKQYIGDFVGSPSDIRSVFTQKILGKEIVQARTDAAQDISIGLKPVQDIGLDLKPTQTQFEDVLQKTTTQIKIIPRETQQPQQIPKEISRQAQKITQIQEQPLRLTQKLRQVLKITQRIPTKTTTRITRIPRPPRVPPPRIPRIPLPEPTRERLMEAVKEVKKEFEVFARTRGEDVLIGKATTQEKAVKLLRKELKGSIKASGFIEEDGERIPFRNLGILNGEFRKSRLDSSRVVQIKEARLGTPSEVEEIHLFGKAKGGSRFRNPKNKSFI